MVIKIKNKKLHSRIQKKLDVLEKKQLQLIKQKRFKEANKVGLMSDKLYDNNYDKMYTIIVKGKKLKSYKDIK